MSETKTQIKEVVQSIRTAKIELEKAIALIISKFESETGINIAGVEVDPNRVAFQGRVDGRDLFSPYVRVYLAPIDVEDKG